ncbi:SymE family type I addiction module toxin [Pectobacterium versatile]|uniref:SymE family type I addiction module toxin n=1 Tax=Pectobacterium versatile TaxID=2488639 RepID=UPI003D10D0A4
MHRWQSLSEFPRPPVPGSPPWPPVPLAGSHCPCRISASRLCRSAIPSALFIGFPFLRWIALFRTLDGGVPLGLRGFLRLQLAFRAHDIHHLRADFTNQLRLFQAFLLFLFVKDRAERVVRVLNVMAQRSDILHLTGKWLEDLGFNTGQPVIVTVEHGKLVIETELRF